MTRIFTCYCGNMGVGTNTQIRVGTKSWPWRRKFTHRPSRDSNPWPFNHNSGALSSNHWAIPTSKVIPHFDWNLDLFSWPHACQKGCVCVCVCVLSQEIIYLCSNPLQENTRFERFILPFYFSSNIAASLDCPVSCRELTGQEAEFWEALPASMLWFTSVVVPMTTTGGPRMGQRAGVSKMCCPTFSSQRTMSTLTLWKQASLGFAVKDVFNGKDTKSGQ